MRRVHIQEVNSDWEHKFGARGGKESDGGFGSGIQRQCLQSHHQELQPFLQCCLP
ncbi:unnamed protein product [Linum tenue]|uniref:Uncharacterized protein n=1 Tax=Linum tenue TaxID=586396 RepID=A0AAV0M1R8_9ROSI|nr:unnamed protein product [Linum tenue]